MKKLSEISVVIIVSALIVIVVEILISNNIKEFILNIFLTSLFLYLFRILFSFQVRKDGWALLEKQFTIRDKNTIQKFHEGSGMLNKNKYTFLMFADNIPLPLTDRQSFCILGFEEGGKNCQTQDLRTEPVGQRNARRKSS